MNKIPLPTDLPWQVQLLFWVLMLLVAFGLGMLAWFLRRYVQGKDQGDREVKEKFDSITKKFEDLKSSVNMSLEANLRGTLEPIQKIYAEQAKLRSDVVEKLSELNVKVREVKDDTEIVKGLSKTVDTQREVLKTLIVKLQNVQIFKTKP